MTLRPLSFAGATLTAVHSDPVCGREFTTNILDLRQPVGPEGPSPDVVVIECPFDGWSTSWPLLGGEQGLAQAIHLEVAIAKGEPFAAAKARVLARLDAVAHPNRELYRTARNIGEVRARPRP